MDKHLLMFDFFLEAGRAVAIPILSGTYQPYDPESGVTDGDRGLFFQPREIVIQWVREFRRTIDYLMIQPDIDGDRLAYYGMFLGATHAPIVLALEPRIRAAFTESGALWKDYRPPRDVDPFHFLPHVRTSVLMMNGRYGVNWPYQNYQLPMLELLGTPPEHKRLVSGAFNELVPIHFIAREASPWFDEYLGSVEGF